MSFMSWRAQGLFADPRPLNAMYCIVNGGIAAADNGSLSKWGAIAGIRYGFVFGNPYLFAVLRTDAYMFR